MEENLNDEPIQPTEKSVDQSAEPDPTASITTTPTLYRSKWIRKAPR